MQDTIIAIIIGVASAIIYDFLKKRVRSYRIKSLRQKVEEIQFKRETLEYINVGYKNLIHHAVKHFAFSLSIICALFALSTAISSISISKEATLILKTITIILYLILSGICWSLWREVHSLRNFEKAKEELDHKESKLDKKIQKLSKG